MGEGGESCPELKKSYAHVAIFTTITLWSFSDFSVLIYTKYDMLYHTGALDRQG